MSHSHSQATRAPSPDYVRRIPEEGVLYRVVSQHYNTFLTMLEMEGKRLPAHVTDEFEAFLECGILARGFVRFQCESCKHERIAAFSCKKRGFCSSCGGRRMAETAAHLVDYVFPRVGIRQYVISFPFQIRFLLLRESKTQSHTLAIVHRAISGFIKKKLKSQGIQDKNIQAGAVTLIQRFGSSLNANPHFHALVLEGGYSALREKKAPNFHEIETPTDEDIKTLVKTIATRVVRYLKKQGHFQDDEPSLDEPGNPSSEIMAELQAASIRSKIAVGERNGKPVRRLGSLGRVFDENPVTKSPLCAAIQGFSLHAGVYCAPDERAKLEKVSRYIARPAITEERLRFSSSGDILYKLKRAYSDGTSMLMFSPLELIEKMAALVPPPRVHLTRFFGVLAPHAKIRSQIIPKQEEPKPLELVAAPNTPPETQKTKSNKKRISWARLLARVFNIDISCPNCHTELKPISIILEAQAITKILNHLGLPRTPPPVAPARLSAAWDYCQA